MKKTIKKQLNKLQAGLLLLCMMFAAAAVSAADVYAAGYGDTFSVVVPYTHIYDAEASRAGDEFTYMVIPQDGAPEPEGSSNGVYRFTVKAETGGKPVSGEIDMNIVFNSPGEYHYKVMAEAGNIKEVTYESRTYTVNVYVQTAKDGSVNCMLTAVGDNGRKYERLQFNPSYETTGLTERPTTTPEDEGGRDNPPADTPDGDNPNTGNPGGNPGGGNPGGGNPGNGNPGDGTPAPGAPDGTPADDGNPLTELFNNVVPKAAPERNYCSLVNILLTILSIIIAFVLTVRYFGRVDSEDDEYIIWREGRWRLASVVPAIISAVTLLCVEDLSLPKKWITDEWTPFLAGMFILSMVITAIVIIKYDRDYNRDLNPGA